MQMDVFENGMLRGTCGPARLTLTGGSTKSHSENFFAKNYLDVYQRG
jgi:hypothetical protein